MKFSIALFFLVSSSVFATDARRLRINGSTTVNPVVVEAADHFRANGWTIFIDTQGGSSGGLSALSDGAVDLAMSSRPVTDADRKKFPKTRFKEYTLGYDGVAIVVSKPVFDGGVKSLSKEQLKAIYEGKIKNWKDVGGPDKPIVFFNKEPGRGTWEVFAHFLYGDSSGAPKTFHPEVGANQEALAKVASHPSALTQLSASWVKDHDKVRALAILDEQGRAVSPSIENIKNSTYPLRRALLLVANGEAHGPALDFIHYVQSSAGRPIMEKYGYIVE